MKVLSPRLITREPLPKDRRNIVGYCFSTLHNGYVTEKMYKQHHCGNADGGELCKNFMKCTYGKMWDKISQKEIYRIEKKQEKKLKKEKQKEQQAYLDDVLHTARACADFFCMKIKFTSAKKEGHLVTLYYISPNRYNDWEMYAEIWNILKETYNVAVKLMHIKDIDGNYATL